MLTVNKGELINKQPVQDRDHDKGGCGIAKYPAEHPKNCFLFYFN